MRKPPFAGAAGTGASGATGTVGTGAGCIGGEAAETGGFSAPATSGTADPRAAPAGPRATGADSRAATEACGRVPGSVASGMTLVTEVFGLLAIGGWSAGSSSARIPNTRRSASRPISASIGSDWNALLAAASRWRRTTR